MNMPDFHVLMIQAQHGTTMLNIAVTTKFLLKKTYQVVACRSNMRISFSKTFFSFL